MANAADYFTEEQQLIIKTAVQRAERHTSGELRIFIDSKMEGDVLERAAEVFETLKMHETTLHNGVLIYMAIESRQFAIIGDSGINEHVKQLFWDQLKDEMIPFFKKLDYTGGLLHAIEKTGKALSMHFPISTDDKNELADDIVFGDKK
jgi:uncharacterized membrane protein